MFKSKFGTRVIKSVKKSQLLVAQKSECSLQAIGVSFRLMISGFAAAGKDRLALLQLWGDGLGEILSLLGWILI